MMLSAFCIHVSSGSGLICLSSHWSTHSSQDQVQSTIKLALLQKAKNHENHKTTKLFSQAGVRGHKAESMDLMSP